VGEEGGKGESSAAYNIEGSVSGNDGKENGAKEPMVRGAMEPVVGESGSGGTGPGGGIGLIEK
jgi:hypothetical protein